MQGAKVGASLSPLGTAASIPTILSIPCRKQLSLSLREGGEDEQQRKKVDFGFVRTTRWTKHRNDAYPKEVKIYDIVGKMHGYRGKYDV